jgi:hypothetical protein
MDWELLLPFGFISFALLGLGYGGFAGYRYLSFERQSDSPRLPVAIAALAIQYGFVFVLFFVRHYALVPTILMLPITIALITVIRLGLEARSTAGTRIALAGLFTFCAYLCKAGSDYYQFLKFRIPG